MDEALQHSPVVIIGGGIGGLTAALGLARAGTPVTILERDPLPPTADAEATFAAERRGAPQVHQTHGFLARIQVVLRERLPDVYADLLASGAFPMPMTSALGDPRPGDEDLQVLIVRRTTLEWVLRKAAANQDGVTFRTGVGVAGLVAGPPHADGTPVVTGVVLEDGTTLPARLVVACTGRRGANQQWLADLGVEIPETIVESGLMYVTRWYRDPGHEVPVDAKLGGDLGFVKFLGIPGDGGTLSVTLAVRTEDRELRQALADPDRFDLACQLLPGPDTFFRDGPLEALTPVLTMSGLLNRIRRFVDDDRPRVLGFLALGDAHTTTNPLYGRGCSLAAVQATLLVDALADHPAADPTCLSALALRYEADSAREIEPWYEASVQMDKMGADPTGASALRRAGADGDAAKAMGAVFAAAASDPVIGRAIAKLMNLLIKPADMMADPEFLTAAAKVMADPDAYPTPAQSGPSRAELLVSLTDAA